MAATAKKAFYFCKTRDTRGIVPYSAPNFFPSETLSKLGVARVLLAPARDGLAGHDVGDELLARQLRAGERVRLLRPQPVVGRGHASLLTRSDTWHSKRAMGTAVL